MVPSAHSTTSPMISAFDAMHNDWKTPVHPRCSQGVWSEDEHNRFLEAFKLYPQGPWKAITAHVGTRSIRQVQTHAQKYQEKVQRRARGLKTVHPRMIHRDHRIDDDIEPWWTRECGMLTGSPTRTTLRRRRRRRRKDHDETVSSPTSSIHTQRSGRVTSGDDTDEFTDGDVKDNQFEPLPFSPDLLPLCSSLPSLEECLAVVSECLATLPIVDL